MSSPRSHSIAFPTMGTVATVSWSGSDASTFSADALSVELQTRAGELESLMSRFIPDSEVSLLGPRWTEVSVDTATVLRAAADYTQITRGYFNPLLAHQMRHWEAVVHEPGTGSSSPFAPTAGASIEQDGPLFRLRDADPGSIDLGAIAKGYATDELRSLLVQMGFTDVLVSLGGSSIAIAGASTKVGITSPWHGWERIGNLTLDSGSMSISADPDTKIQSQARTLSRAPNQQPSSATPDIDGVRLDEYSRPARQRSHVLNPHTREPAMTDLCEVIVCGENGMACEAFSTAYLAMGLDQAMILDVEHPEIATMFFTVDGRMLADPRLKITTVPGLADWLKTQY